MLQHFKVTHNFSNFWSVFIYAYGYIFSLWADHSTQDHFFYSGFFLFILATFKTRSNDPFVLQSYNSECEFTLLVWLICKTYKSNKNHSCWMQLNGIICYTTRHEILWMWPCKVWKFAYLNEKQRGFAQIICIHACMHGAAFIVRFNPFKEIKIR